MSNSLIRNVTLVLLATAYSLAMNVTSALKADVGTLETFIGQNYPAHDTLAIEGESNRDAVMSLQHLGWIPAKFDVAVTAPVDSKREDLLVRFPSPRPGEVVESREVVMEVRLARDSADNVLKAPAVVIVHESGRKMTVGRMIADGLHQRGVHAFLLQLPGYGERQSREPVLKGNLLASLDQGIADVRRARDAVVVLPFVAHDRVTLQGTSLGGFVCSTAAGLDNGYHNVFLLLSGGDVYEVLQKGQRDAQGVRNALKEAGLTDDEIKQAAWNIEPNRLAHRVVPERTWLYAGVFDQVVPIANSRSFAKAAALPEKHFIEMPADHYTGVLFLSAILDHISSVSREIPFEDVRK